MRVTPTDLPDLLLLEPDVFADHRGSFLESYNERRFDEATGARHRFVQDNQSVSVRHVLRGLHYQIDRPQGKLVRVVRGEIFDVAVDIRRSSPSFGRWAGVTLSEDSPRQLWIPAGFAHGFVVLSETAQVLYKTTDYYTPSAERTLRWDDPDIGIRWPVTPVILSAKDAAGTALRDAELFP